MSTGAAEESQQSWSEWARSWFPPWGGDGSAGKTPGETTDDETTGAILKRWADIGVKLASVGIHVALFVPASISLFFVGLFLSVGGLDYFLLIDKLSMLASLFLYAAVLSAITMIVTFVPRLVTSKEILVWLARALGLLGFSIYIIGLEYTVLFALLVAPGCILLLVRLRQLRHRRKGPESEEHQGGPQNDVRQDRPLSAVHQDGQRWHQDLDRLKLVISLLLFCCLSFGYLRGEHLREQPASMIIHLADAKQAPVPVTVIMSFDQGVLVFQPPNAEPRLYPWDRIASIASAPSQGGISQRLRDWRDAVRGWIRRAQ